jgi:hypothetical protein
MGYLGWLEFLFKVRRISGSSGSLAVAAIAGKDVWSARATVMFYIEVIVPLAFHFIVATSTVISLLLKSG